MFGWGYVKDTCIALFKKEQREKLILTYFSECLRILTENTAGAEKRNYINLKLDDILNPKIVEEKSADDIINRMKNKAKKINSKGSD